MAFTYPKTEFGETSFPLQLQSGSPSGFQLLRGSRAAADPLQHWLEKNNQNAVLDTSVTCRAITQANVIAFQRN